MLEIAEGEFAIRAAQPLRENETKRGTAKDKLPPGPHRKKATRARPLLVVQQGEGASLAVRIGRKVHMNDGGTIGLAPRAPPPDSRRCHC